MSVWIYFTNYVKTYKNLPRPETVISGLEEFASKDEAFAFIDQRRAQSNDSEWYTVIEGDLISLQHPTTATAFGNLRNIFEQAAAKM